uniref:hypothetical protein n=1 Tax=Streptomyces flavofungini TaxID=68200 RepID=UPI0034DE990F
GLGRHCVRAAPELLALGALKHAPPLTATLVGGAAEEAGRRRALEEPGSVRPRDVGRARLLIGQGRTGEASALLREIIAEARELLEGLGQERQAPAQTSARTSAHIPAPTPAPPEEPHPVPELDRASRRQLARAQSLLSLGHYDHAVQAAHIAWQDAATRPTGADMLDAMIDVHCAAAMADMSPEHFADAERWLNCAYGHDPTNVRVRGLLAERTYRHAVELDRRAERDEAIEALGKCLTWDPEHAAAEALLRRLNRDGRNRRGRGDVLG